jgi:hypothetical protein
MLYPKREQKLTLEDFKNPGNEYRAAPFWAWNKAISSSAKKTAHRGSNSTHTWRSLSNPWFNSQTYANTLDKATIQEFIRVTYEAYEKRFAGDFGGVIPAIFTDEPQFSQKGTLDYAFEDKDIPLPWTFDIEEPYQAAYGGESLSAGLILPPGRLRRKGGGSFLRHNPSGPCPGFWGYYPPGSTSSGHREC